MFIEPLLASLVGGLIGGIATGVTVILVLRAKGQKWFIDPQVDYLEKQLKEVVVEQAFGQIIKLLDRGERIGQVAARAMEIFQLVRGAKIDFTGLKSAAAAVVAGSAPPPQQPQQGPADQQLAMAHAAMGSALARLGRGPDAQREFEQALRLDPNNLPALQGIRALGTPPREVAAAEPASKQAP